MLTAAKRPGIGCGQRIVIDLPILAAGSYDVMPFQSAACTTSYGIIRPAGQQHGTVAFHQAPLAVLAHGIISVRNQIILGQHDRRVGVAHRQHDCGIAGALCRRCFRCFRFGYSRCFGRFRCWHHRRFWRLRGRRCTYYIRRICRFCCTSRQNQYHSCTKYPFHRFSSLPCLFLY